MARKLKEEEIYVYMWQIQFIVQQKLYNIVKQLYSNKRKMKIYECSYILGFLI